MTIRHLVLFHLHDDVRASDPRVAAACAAERALATGVPGDHRWTFGPDVSRRAESADFAGAADFDSPEDLKRFLNHPAHHAAAGLWADLATWSVADLEVQP